MENELLGKRLELFPISTQIQEINEINILTIAGCDLADLAERYGTPLYLYDCLTLDNCVSEYRNALKTHYPSQSGITYAGKAFLCTALVQWSQMHDLWLDCSSAGEVSIALAGGARRNHILLHGVNKGISDLQDGVKNAGTLVVDHLDELKQLVVLRKQTARDFPELWLRLRPEITVDTHVHTQTGQPDSKFGMDTAEAGEAVRICLDEGLPLTGVHFHLGSHFHDPSPLAVALERALDFIVETNEKTGWMPKTLCPGGGWGVAYHEIDLPQPQISTYIQFIAAQLVEGCKGRNIPLPCLQIEPGRSLIARAGVAIYRVGAVKMTPHRRWLLVDGGMADNPRPALYNSRYSALPVIAPDRPVIGPAWLGGKYCESGDTLIEDLLMPEIAPGELLAIPASGAYHLSMSSNYNGAPKPAVLWLDGDQAYLIQKRQEPEDLLRRDLPLPRIKILK